MTPHGAVGGIGAVPDVFFFYPEGSLGIFFKNTGIIHSIGHIDLRIHPNIRVFFIAYDKREPVRVFFRASRYVLVHMGSQARRLNLFRFPCLGSYQEQLRGNAFIQRGNKAGVPPISA